ncbi:hypothetical protein JH26_08730 [Microvirga sp. BSC39]|nr:hypothetical protein JH26_08730 [Microvirga sp. BSC39]
MAKPLLQHVAGDAAEALAVVIRSDRPESGLRRLFRQDAHRYHSGEDRNRINHQSDECRPEVILILTKVSFYQLSFRVSLSHGAS